MALLTLEWNYIPLMRVQVPIDCLLQKIPFVLDAVMKKVGDKVIKGTINYNQFTIQIYTHTSFVLRFISIWMIALGLIIAVLGGVLPNTLV